MPMDKRLFLKALVGGMVGASTTRLWSAPTGGSGARFVLVFLRGAYDGLSALVPYADSFYYESRPGIAIARPEPGNPAAALPLDGRWGLHPALGESLMPLYEARQLAWVPFAGTAFVSRSHFQAQDWVESGLLPQQRPNPASGFLNRLVAELHGTDAAPEAVSFTAGLPIAMRGKAAVVNTGLPAGRPAAISASYEQLLSQLYAGHPLQPQVNDGLGLRREMARYLDEEMQAASRGALPPAGFVREAARIGRVMREHPAYGVAFVDVGGWDTHAGQGAAQGLLAGRLRSLGEGVAALRNELGAEWGHTVVVVLSEFGRTFRENGSRGTDHGHGSTFWVAGGGISGGRVAGEQLPLAAGTLHEDRDVPVANEYRNLLGGLFQRMYGLGPDRLERVFPGARGDALGLV